MLCAEPGRIVYLSQLILILAVVTICVVELSLNNGSGEYEALWAALLSGSIGYLIPGPSLKKKRNMSSHFYITLPSNSSELYYPGNSVTNYITHLDGEISLEGLWEMGLSELHFPRNWLTFGSERYTLQILFTCYDRSSTANGLPTCAQYDRYEVKIPVPIGYYENPWKFFDALNENVEKAFVNELRYFNADGPPHELGKITERKIPTFQMDNNRASVTVPSNCRLIIPDQLAAVFGFTPQQRDIKNTSQQSYSVSYGWKAFDLTASINAVYVYCDAIQHTNVGDTTAPLLRIVDAQGSYGDIKRVIFDNIRYFPLRKNNFRTIEIDLRDCYGENIKFEGGQSVAVLHFRRVKGQ